MANFHALEIDVIRRAEAMSILEAEPERYAFGTLRTVVDLCDAIALGEPIDHISEAMGRVAIDMIVLCAMLDIDLAKSLETAFNKISAKPTAQVLAAQERADAASKKWNDGASATDYTPVENPAVLTTQGTVTEVTFPPPSEANIAAMEKLLGNVVHLKRD